MKDKFQVEEIFVVFEENFTFLFCINEAPIDNCKLDSS